MEKEGSGRGAIATCSATAASATGDKRWMRHAAGHGLLLCCLWAQQQQAGPVQPVQGLVGLSGGSLRSCSLLFESHLGSYEPTLWWLHSTYRSVGRL